MGKKAYLEVGEVASTHGVRGEVRVQPWCDSPALFSRFRRLYWDDRGENPIEVQGRAHKDMGLIKIKGVDTVEQAAALRGRVLYARREDIPLPKGKYFVQDLLGLTVVDADTGDTYGTLTDVSQTGANAVYHMATPKGEVLIPAIPSVVTEVNVDEERIKIKPMEGLFDDAL